ncbi:reverse transcriptase domain-containing protein [Bathymodiolus thermophilus thioautotrophic gill symbiont]|nr:reverse transcriptase domain-containing protein [Bathymodiolus thermophilus thioautotrophic gill symbiont]
MRRIARYLMKFWMKKVLFYTFHKLYWDFWRCPKDNIVKLMTFEGTLPLGFSSSGRLSNSILLKFDQAVLSQCKPQKITYSRYADDLIFSSNDTNIKQVKSTVEDILASMFNQKLKINHNKTKTYSKKSRVKILGMVITPNGEIHKVFGIVSYINSVDKNFLNKLRKKYGNYNKPNTNGKAIWEQ